MTSPVDSSLTTTLCTGGIYARYTAALLFDEKESTIAGLIPRTFITVASPNLGVRDFGVYRFFHPSIQAVSNDIAQKSRRGGGGGKEREQTDRPTDRPTRPPTVDAFQRPLQRNSPSVFFSFSLRLNLFLLLDLQPVAKAVAGLTGEEMVLCDPGELRNCSWCSDKELKRGTLLCCCLEAECYFVCRLSTSLLLCFFKKLIYRLEGRFNKGPLLVEMSEDQENIQFLSSLKAFKRKILYGNVQNDFMVAFGTATLDPTVTGIKADYVPPEGCEIIDEDKDPMGCRIWFHAKPDPEASSPGT